MAATELRHDLTLGKISDDVHIVDGANVTVEGNINGDVTVSDDSELHVHGDVRGSVTTYDTARVIVRYGIGGRVQANGRSEVTAQRRDPDHHINEPEHYDGQSPRR